MLILVETKFDEKGYNLVDSFSSGVIFFECRVSTEKGYHSAEFHVSHVSPVARKVGLSKQMYLLSEKRTRQNHMLVVSLLGGCNTRH